ncbi:hypothetical protein D9M70_438050 [compost metagenome]
MAEGIVTHERIRQALTTGPGFTEDERRLLWFSPDVRETYFDVRGRLDREIQDQLHLAGYGEELRMRAASGSGDVHTIIGKGYALTVFHDHIGGADEWSLSLQLDDAFKSRLFPLTAIRLFDSGGLTWLRGIPDEVGHIGSIWEEPAEIPLERAARYGLFIGV